MRVAAHFCGDGEEALLRMAMMGYTANAQLGKSFPHLPDLHAMADAVVSASRAGCFHPATLVT
jgi:hypothetical protein